MFLDLIKIAADTYQRHQSFKVHVLDAGPSQPLNALQQEGSGCLDASNLAVEQSKVPVRTSLFRHVIALKSLGEDLFSDTNGLLDFSDFGQAQ